MILAAAKASEAFGQSTITRCVIFEETDRHNSNTFSATAFNSITHSNQTKSQPILGARVHLRGGLKRPGTTPGMFFSAH